MKTSAPPLGAGDPLGQPNNSPRAIARLARAPASSSTGDAGKLCKALGEPVRVTDNGRTLTIERLRFHNATRVDGSSKVSPNPRDLSHLFKGK